ncbi:hypothetical protein ACFX11_038335 [Malus domestica]
MQHSPLSVELNTESSRLNGNIPTYFLTVKRHCLSTEPSKLRTSAINTTLAFNFRLKKNKKKKAYSISWWQRVPTSVVGDGVVRRLYAKGWAFLSLSAVD